MVGKSVTLNGVPFTVIGVAPVGFCGVNSLFGPDGWVPMSMFAQLSPSATRNWLDERRALAFSLAGRLKPGDDDRAGIGEPGGVGETLEQLPRAQ